MIKRTGKAPLSFPRSARTRPLTSQRQSALLPPKDGASASVKRPSKVLARARKRKRKEATSIDTMRPLVLRGPPYTICDGAFRSSVIAKYLRGLLKTRNRSARRRSKSQAEIAS